jgi:hypothetical protein
MSIEKKRKSDGSTWKPLDHSFGHTEAPVSSISLPADRIAGAREEAWVRGWNDGADFCRGMSNFVISHLVKYYGTEGVFRIGVISVISKFVNKMKVWCMVPIHTLPHFILGKFNEVGRCLVGN